MRVGSAGCVCRAGVEGGLRRAPAAAHSLQQPAGLLVATHALPAGAPTPPCWHAHIRAHSLSLAPTRPPPRPRPASSFLTRWMPSGGRALRTAAATTRWGAARGGGPARGDGGGGGCPRRGRWGTIGLLLGHGTVCVCGGRLERVVTPIDGSGSLSRLQLRSGLGRHSRPCPQLHPPHSPTLLLLQVQRTMLEIVNQLDGFDSRGNIKVRLPLILLHALSAPFVGFPWGGGSAGVGQVHWKQWRVGRVSGDRVLACPPPRPTCRCSWPPTAPTRSTLR